MPYRPRRLDQLLRQLFLACGLLTAGRAAFAADTLPKQPTAEDRELESVARLMDLAWSPTPATAEELKNAYESQLGRVADRARWHFAYGLGALQLKKYPAAATAFEAATRDAKTFRFSPWKALIWTELTLDRYDSALQRVGELAKKLVAPDFSGTLEEREQVAGWIGQTLGAVEKLHEPPKNAKNPKDAKPSKILKQLTATDDILAENWPDSLLEACRNGRDYTNLLYDELMEQMQQASDAAKSKEKQSLDEQRKLIEKTVADAEERKAALAKLAEEVKHQTEQRVTQIDKQLTRLDRDYQYLEARALTITQSISILQSEMISMQTQRQLRAAGGQNGANTVDTQSQFQYNQLNLLMSMYRQELETTMMRGAMIAQQAMNGLQMRGQLLQQAQLKTQDLGGQHESLTRWQERKSKDAEILKQTKPKGKSKTVRDNRIKAKNINTYLNFEREWERILLTQRQESP